MSDPSATVDKKGRLMIGRGGDLTESKRLASVKLHIPSDPFDESGNPKSVASADGWTVFCTNFNKECGIDDIEDLFSDFGDIQSIKVDFDPITMESRGYFFVKYKRRESADAAIAGLHNTMVHRKKIEVCYAFYSCPEGYIPSSDDGVHEEASRKRVNEAPDGTGSLQPDMKESTLV